MIKEIKVNEKAITSTKELVDVFNEHFISIGPNLAETVSNENNGSFQDFFSKQDSEFSFRPVNVAMVYNLINNLSISKATGLDKMLSKVLFNMPMDSNQFPSDWKTAIVIPLHKKGQ